MRNGAEHTPTAPWQAPFAEMHAVVAALRAHDVQPALDWARANREALSRAAEAGAGGGVEWQLHRLRFLTLLRQVRQVLFLQEGRG